MIAPVIFETVQFKETLRRRAAARDSSGTMPPATYVSIMIDAYAIVCVSECVKSEGSVVEMCTIDHEVEHIDVTSGKILGVKQTTVRHSLNTVYARIERAKRDSDPKKEDWE